MNTLCDKEMTSVWGASYMICVHASLPNQQTIGGAECHLVGPSSLALYRYPD